MKIQNFAAGTPAVRPSLPAQASTETPAPADKLEVDFQGSRPAHRNVKKLARTAAGVVGAAGVAGAVYAFASAPSVESGLMRAGLALAGGAVGVVGIDLVSGFGHHWGDNYGLPRPQTLDHTKWHTDLARTDYCLVGLSNKALDKIEFWPKWENFLHKNLGKTPVSWEVPAYKAYCQGEIDKNTLMSQLARAGLQ